MRVVDLWRFPVKSMQGEALEEAVVDGRGILGDRQWALVDRATGLALTARRVPELLFASARWHDGDVQIELPDGTSTTDDGDLSRWLGRDVTLVAAGTGVRGRYEIATDFEQEATSAWVEWDGPEDTFHDSGRTRLSILSTATIGAWDRRRFRANVVVDAAAAGEEDGLVGRGVDIGEVRLDILKQIDRCVITTRPQPGGIERDLDVLRTINAERATCLGVAATVLEPGTIHLGDDLHPLDP